MDHSSDPFLNTFHRWMEVFLRRSFQDFIHSARKNGVSMSQINAMFFLKRAGSGGVSDIAGSLDVTNAAASQLLDRLVQQGLILRREDPDDRRLKQIELTEKGEQLVEESMRARHQLVMEISASLTPAEKEQVIAALEVLIQRAEALTLEGEA